VAFDVRRCPVAEHFRAEGLSQLCVESWCNLDYAVAEKWGARLERTTTLAEGAERCDFRWCVAQGGEPCT
jgi:ubiquinone biosynthesis protein